MKFRDSACDNCLEIEVVLDQLSNVVKFILIKGLVIFHLLHNLVGFEKSNRLRQLTLSFVQEIFDSLLYWKFEFRKHLSNLNLLYFI
jgi:hypothetical protein